MGSAEHPELHGDPADRFEVLNVGLAGINLEGVVDRLERASEVYDPALLIYGFTINDIEGRAYEKLKPSQDSLRLIRRLKAIAASPSYLYKLVASRWLGLEEKLSPTKSAYPDEIRHNYFENPEAWADFVAALDRFAALARRREVCGHVLLHTHLTELDSGHDYLGVYERVSQAAGQRGLSVTISFPVFEGRAEAELWIDMLDTHPNREGHALMARALREGLRALPASCWEGHSSR